MRLQCRVPQQSRVPSRAPVQAHLAGGNGSSTPRSQTDTLVLVRLEERIRSLEHHLAVQLQRIADLQVQLDRAIADRPIVPTRSRL